MSRSLWVTLGTTLGIGGLVFAASRRASAATPGSRTRGRRAIPSRRSSSRRSRRRAT
jgi:hypothetical protein